MVSKSDFSIGQKVALVPFQHKGKIAIVRYLGPINKRFGTWAGVELEEPSGDMNGTVGDQDLFTCKDNYGLVLRIT